MNNDIIQSMGLIAEEAYKTYTTDSPLEKLPQYTVLDVSNTPSGFQGYLLQNNSPTAGEPKYGVLTPNCTNWGPKGTPYSPLVKRKFL